MSTLLAIDLTLFIKNINIFIGDENMLLQIPKSLKKLAELLPENLYIVGGYNRNHFLGIKGEDIDLCAQIKVEELAKLLENSPYDVKIKNKIVGTAIISVGNEKFEYSCFRREFYKEGGAHTPDKVEFISSLEEDAKRRDFSCNAIYYDIKNDKFIDIYGGIQDIKNKILKTIETPDFVFAHDGLRILRLFRFECELNFKIDKPTLLSAIKYSSNVRDIAGERVIHEITCILHSGNRYPGYSKPKAYLQVFKQFNKYKLWPVFGIDCAKVRLKMVKKVEHKSQGFLIDVVDTVKPISISYYLNLILLEHFGLNKKMASQYINILSGYYDALNRLQNKDYFFKYFDNFPLIYKLLVHKSKYLANKYDFFYKYIISHKLIITVKDLKVNGDDLKKYYPTVKPYRYNAILESLLSDVFDGKLVNDKKVLIKAIEQKLKYL